ncbi:transmembrane amino acid transporter protein-domain-containing protein [Apodospora peruviana]|uniref:Transmembrane amino acid transporter protein-domain-containing protein n=1 Tax=Apodospora peruviana TaxID=516989 RepID=A0AAE0I5H5_9PEZI|nr:transmembrane amino acid transporter protein-domain-containing protein [Apodospora peruviana]
MEGGQHRDNFDGRKDANANKSTRGVLAADGPPQYGVDDPSDGSIVGEVRNFDSDVEKRKLAEGEANFHRLGWKRLTIVLIVTAIALGSLGLPSAFATLGMVAGVILTVGLGLVAMYTSYVVGQMKIKYPEITHFADVGRLMFGRVGYEILGAMFVLQLIFTTGSHVLTGKIMWENITESGICAIVFGVVSAIILFIIAIPPSFAEVAILGYIDCVSILAAILITMIATGISATNAPGGLDAVPWSAWPKDDLKVAEAFIAIANIVFAYSFSLCQFSFMDEMHTPTDFPKAILSLGIIEIVIYTLTGSLIYAFVGPDVKSPALLSAGPLISKVAFGIALPVIFISGSINTVVAGRYLHGRMFKNSVIRYVNTPMGWATWLALDAVITVVAWVIAEAIPFFSDLLAISSSLFISGFTFYIPAVMWFLYIKEGKWYEVKNIPLSLTNALCFSIGVIVLGVGTYSSIQDIINKYAANAVGTPFSCAVAR